VDVSFLVRELVQKILDGENDFRILWRNQTTVEVLANRFFTPHREVGLAQSSEVRKRFISELEAGLAPHGWVKKAGANYVYSRAPRLSPP